MTHRILVIEDQEDNRIILRDLLTSADFEVIEAVNGQEGVDLARAEAYVARNFCANRAYCTDGQPARHSR